jgi:hypothetical protein
MAITDRPIVKIQGNPPATYWDYCFAYRAANGTIAGCLGLQNYCKKIREGKTIKVTNIHFSL